MSKNNVDTILAERGKAYGSYQNNANFAMKFFQQNLRLILGNPNLNENQYNAAFYYMFMIAAKLARLNHNPKHEDSKIDLIGYTIIYKLNCDYRFEFMPLHINDSKKAKKHLEFVEYINSLLKD